MSVVSTMKYIGAAFGISFKTSWRVGRGLSSPWPSRACFHHDSH
jgi:hypothetical protein